METPASYIVRTYFVAMYETQEKRLADSKAFPSGIHIQFGSLPQILQGWVTNTDLDVEALFTHSHYVSVLVEGGQWQVLKNEDNANG